jgi:L-lactate dehydrogenase complex protein LldF
VVEGKRRRHRGLGAEELSMEALGWIFADRRRYELAQRAARVGSGPLARSGRIRRLPAALSGWTDSRDLPALPRQTFRQWWRATRGGDR